MKASARKSFGEYKPMIVHSNGRTEIVGTNAKWQQIQAQTKFYSGPSEIVTYKRGKTFVRRADAVAYAERIIAKREIANAQARAEYAARQAAYASQRPA